MVVFFILCLLRKQNPNGEELPVLRRFAHSQRGQNGGPSLRSVCLLPLDWVSAFISQFYTSKQVRAVPLILRFAVLARPSTATRSSAVRMPASLVCLWLAGQDSP